MPATLTPVTVGINPGNQAAIVQNIAAKGLDEKYNIKIEISEFANPPASAQAVTQGTVDVGFGGLTTMMTNRANGADIIYIGVLTQLSGGVFVPAGSDITTMADLAGKRVGSFTALGGAVSSQVQAISAEGFGVDLLADLDGELHVAPDAAIVGLMDQGDLDAVIMGTDATAFLLFQPEKYTMILDMGPEFQRIFGIPAPYLGPVTLESYAVEHCGETRAFASAVRDSIADVLSDDSFWETYVTELGRPVEAASVYRDVYAKGLMTAEWGQDTVDAMIGLADTIRPYLDPATFPAETDPTLFSLDYMPFPAS
jgi:ABC-type nitrate/sulfonate/bicarbonate transport system substrate-binding protein